MCRIIFKTLLMLLLFTTFSFSQKAEQSELLKGINFIETTIYSDNDNQEILKLYKDLRVSDVSDGLDMVGLPNTGLVDQSIYALWTDLEDFSHRIIGIAITVRFVPTQKKDRPEPGEDFSKWEGDFYGKYSSEVFRSIIKPGSVIVIDDVEEKDIGTIGSNNIMGWVVNGAVGVITDASARDTDEVIKERVPLYLRKKGRGIRPGRNELESVNRPISIGGVLVCPGDIIVADGDGVVVVPRKVAKEVALNALKILEGDKKGRKSLYEKLGKPLDKTVK